MATPAEVQDALSANNVVVLDARSQDAYGVWSTGENSLGGHIAGAKGFSARWLTCAYDDANNNDGRTRDERLQLVMENKGIKTDTPVIIYDESGTDAKAVVDFLAGRGVTDIKLFSLADWNHERVSYVLRYLGVQSVYVMSGGANGWTDAGNTCETGEHKAAPAENFGTEVPLNPSFIDQTDDVKENLNNDNFQLVDTRTMPEYKGETSGFAYVPSAGRIPGSVLVSLMGQSRDHRPVPAP